MDGINNNSNAKENKLNIYKNTLVCMYIHNAPLQTSTAVEEEASNCQKVTFPTSHQHQKKKNNTMKFVHSVMKNFPSQRDGKDTNTSRNYHTNIKKSNKQI